MSTGSIENFAGKINEIGPLYPFTGWEMLFVFCGFVFWIGWHIWQLRIENREYKEELKENISKETLDRFLQREKQDPGV